MIPVSGTPATPAGTGRLAAGATALSVGLLVAATLGTVAAVIVGAGLHLLGIPGDWASAIALVTAAAGLVPAANLGRRVWRLERHGPEN